ncbi:MAG: phage portal protein [Bacteroidota bacterium]|nr:phage portal protein [Bacteroidota bacterium]
MKGNILDNAIAWISPKIGVQRKLWRRSFEAGSYGSRTKSMRNARESGPNTDIASSLATLRKRSRHFNQNNGWAKRAVGVISRKTVGQGIRPAPSVGTEKQLSKAKDLWNRWAATKSCDWDGKMTFYGIQQLVMREIAEAGDCVIIRRRVKPTSDNPLPIQLQVLEGDYIDHQRNGVNENGYARLGVQFDKEGKQIGFWIYSQHPSEQAVSWTGINSEFVAAEDVILAFEVLRAGQVRGIPHGVSCFMKLSDFSDYEDAQLVRQKIASAFAGFKTGAPEDTVKEQEDFNTIQPGILYRLNEGEQMTFSNPPAADGYGEYSKKILQGIAAGYEITYEQLTMDYSNVNFTSGRMAAIEVADHFRDLQYNMMVPQVCVQVWNWFMDAAIMTGLLGVRINCNAQDWTAPRIQLIDPVKETNARISQISAGLTTWSEVIREDGRDPEEFLQEYKTDMGKLKDAGVNFTSVMLSPQEMTQDLKQK